MTRNAQNWQEREERLKAAAALAAFLDLKTADIATFQLKYRDFLPTWVWEETLGYFNSNTKVGSRNEPEKYLPWLKLQNHLKQVWDEGFFEEAVLDFISEHSFFLNDSIAHTDDCRKAVLFLYENSWRAKICPQCKHRFIANHSQSECCSLDCAALQRKDSKGDWYNRIKDVWNAERRREYAAEKRKRKPKQKR